MSGALDHARRQLLACLVGGAVGDSLGCDLEFMRLEDIQARFPEGVEDLGSDFHKVRGAITDDTQMTLFTAEGIIRAKAEAAASGSGLSLADQAGHVHRALLRWLRTQENPDGRPLLHDDDSGIIKDPRLWRRRSPGRTCMEALAKARDAGGSHRPARNCSKGCGTIMRVAPVALMARRGLVRRLAVSASALTHGHPTGQFAAAAWANMLADVAGGAHLEDSARRIASGYAGSRDGRETADAILNALNADRSGLPQDVERLGGGWIAEEALSIALYACLCPGSVENRLRIAVTHSGDSDSTGAIAGNMLGVMEPDAMLDHRWAGEIECRDIIDGLADEYFRVLESERHGALPRMNPERKRGQ